MKRLLVGAALSAFAVSPLMAADDFKALAHLSAAPTAMTDRELELIVGGLVSVSTGNINAANCVAAYCKNSGNQFNNSSDESGDGGLVSVSTGNINAANCVAAYCKNSGNQFNNSSSYYYQKKR
jgi:hypothetical protein